MAKTNNEEEISYKIKARIVDREKGMTEITDIHMIRLKSKDHNLLIMEDYMPIIGELSGSVEFVLYNESVKMEIKHGFYMHKQNEFSLLIDV